MNKGFRIVIKRTNLEKFITVLTFVLIYGLMLYLLDIRLLFANTVISGGDTGSHIYMPYYLKQIFPLIRWWSPDWYSGFPFLYYYPPLMFFLATLLSFVIPINISFKLIIFLGVIIYPIAAYFFFKWLGMKFPIPQLGAVFSLSLLFFEKFTIYGGNLPSLLSGQFSHTVSIGLLLLFLGLMYKGMVERKFFVFNILLGSSVMLTHPVSAILTIFIAPFLIFQSKKIKQNILYVFNIYLGIFLLTAFWTFGLVFYKEYSGYMEWGKQIKLDEIFPPHLRYLTIGGGLGILLAVIKREKRLVGLFVLFLITSLAYALVDKSNIWNNRFLPYVLFSTFLMAAYFYGSVAIIIRKWVSFLPLIVIVVFMVFSLSVVKRNVSFSSFWFKWNFEGYENKSTWRELNGLFSYLKKIPQGRVMWEYRPEFDKYGTTRVLETIPVFTGQPTFEGLLVDSALNSPFHFITQSETTQRPTSAIAGFEYPPFDFAKGIRHMQLSGTSYFIAYTEEIKREAENSKELKVIQDAGQFRVYQLENSALVESVKSFEIDKKNKDWLKRSIEWFKGEDLEKPIVFYTNNKEKDYLSVLQASYSSRDAKAPENIISGKDYVEFDVKAVGLPYIVKTTYFPTWRVKGAYGPYLVSPSYMMVVPTEKHVKLYFTYGFVDWLGIAFTA
ncbi:6-pyruvoyl-tetrahydropterin synthase-related protein, partial [Patescibacteria group bacterium]|nr:6-pyruvoyl-tetrahydropterin synthase-related protein [Patescibacteria group bacterium]